MLNFDADVKKKHDRLTRVARSVNPAQRAATPGDPELKLPVHRVSASAFSEKRQFRAIDGPGARAL